MQHLLDLVYGYATIHNQILFSLLQRKHSLDQSAYRKASDNKPCVLFMYLMNLFKKLYSPTQEKHVVYGCQLTDPL